MSGSRPVLTARQKFCTHITPVLSETLLIKESASRAPLLNSMSTTQQSCICVALGHIPSRSHPEYVSPLRVSVRHLRPPDPPPLVRPRGGGNLCPITGARLLPVSGFHALYSTSRFPVPHATSRMHLPRPCPEGPSHPQHPVAPPWVT